MLAELMRLRYGIAIAGMHGKTTTTSMVAAVLAGGGLDPTVVVGGRVDALGSNARLGTSQYLVVEADESDRSFLKLSPVLGVVTNLDREHMDCYRDMADIAAAFVEFMDSMPCYGATTVCIDDPLLRGVLPRVNRRIFTYGERVGAEFRLRRLPSDRADDAQSRFLVTAEGEGEMGPFSLHVPGLLNVLYARAAVAMGVQLGVAPEQIAAGLASFRGVDRRFQVRGEMCGVIVVDDYGHHPTEVLATLGAAREATKGRVLVLFQPHRYTRTRDLMREFAGAFGGADRVEIVDIYAASEEPLAGITAEVLVAAIARERGDEAVQYAPTMEEAVRRLARDAGPGDLVVTLGAGSVGAAGPMLLQALAH